MKENHDHKIIVIVCLAIAGLWLIATLILFNANLYRSYMKDQLIYDYYHGGWNNSDEKYFTFKNLPQNASSAITAAYVVFTIILALWIILGLIFNFANKNIDKAPKALMVITGIVLIGAWIFTIVQFVSAQNMITASLGKAFNENRECISGTCFFYGKGYVTEWNGGIVWAFIFITLFELGGGIGSFAGVFRN